MKTRFLVGVFALLVTLGPVYAQESSSGNRESDYYYVNVTLEKIYSYRKGYVVSYRKGMSDMAQAYLPLEWFQGTDAPSEIVRLGSGSTWPSLSVYYKNGTFSHVRLYVRREMGHSSWGSIPQTADLDSYFENVEDFKLEF